jgi:DNA-binding CsgD family transcriptional regulator
MFVVDEKDGVVVSLPAAEIAPSQGCTLSTSLAQRIVAILAKEELYPKEIARRLRVQEQKVYYHINRLHKAKIILASRKEYVQGANATYYRIAKPAFVVRFRDFEKAQNVNVKSDAGMLAPFVKDGRFDGVIIMGSPDPHGPAMARSRDAMHAMDLAMFFGSYLTYAGDLVVRMDTDVNEKGLRQNMIVIGGPIVNSLTAKLNSRMPIRFDEQNNYALISTISGKSYLSESSGLVVRMQNPWNPLKQILVVAGTRGAGTRAVVLSFLKHFTELSKGNTVDDRVLAKVVEGIDVDGDGVVDDARIIE